MSKDTGGPAFPVPVQNYKDQEGMTLRDYFAAKAMQGMLCNGFIPNIAQMSPTQHNFDYVTAAYRLADAMISERAK